MTRSLRIAVDARMRSAEGGVGSFVIGLASGLSRLGGEDEYLFLTVAGHDAWLHPYLRGNCRIIHARHPRAASWKLLLARHVPSTVTVWNRLKTTSRSGAVVGVGESDGVIEADGVDVVHLTGSDGFHTDVPTIYHPHDLQHIHLPQFFTPEEIARRELVYRDLCARATMVAVSSAWTRDDLEAHYGLSGDKVRVVPLAPLLPEYPEPNDTDLERVREKLTLTDGGFAFYPAQTWEHKNHITLLEALAQLKSSGLTVPLVSCGKKTEFFSVIESKARELGIQDQVRFLGFVSPLELQCLYRLSRCVVIPTRFEAASFPLWEAFLSGTPAACSTVTSLPEQAGDAALLFDPDRSDEIVKAVRTLWEDEGLRQTLVKRAHKNVSRLSWDRTAQIFRAHYRRLAGCPLSADDSSLLGGEPRTTNPELDVSGDRARW